MLPLTEQRVVLTTSGGAMAEGPLLSMGDRAIHWWSQDVSVIPLKPREKTPLLRTWLPYRDRLPTPEELIAWFWRQDHRNLGVIASRGLVVLDFDNLEYWRLFCEVCPPPETYQVETARGVHLYYRIDEPVKASVLPWVEVKSGGYVVGAGSTHPSGKVYTDNGAEIARVGRLTDVIPPGLLPVTEQTRPRVSQPTPGPEPVPDPWKVASSPELYNGPNLAATIKKRVSILRFFPDARPTGGGFYLARCPLHNDHNPSMWINTHLGVCGCYAGCTTKPLDVINLHGRLNNLDNSAALDDLRRKWLQL